MARRKTKTPEPVVQGPPAPPAGVTKVNPHDCFVVGTFGYMLGVDRPDEFYYGGPTEEGRDAARSAADAEVAWRQNLGHTSLKFYVSDLSDYLSSMQNDAKQEGYQSGVECNRNG